MKITSAAYRNFELTIKKIYTQKSRPHRHNCFEMIYVLQGNGRHFINGNQYDYQQGNLFVLNTNDIHAFKTLAPTELCLIDFTGSFFSFIGSEDKSDYPSAVFFENMEYVFHNQHYLKGNIITKENDQQWVDILISRLLWEKEQNGYGTEDICKNIVFLLLQLITRYIREHSIFPLKAPRADKMIRGITNYIHLHISDNKSLRVENIAGYFCKSKDHLSLYFKKQTGLTLKDYILSYKLELAKTRLLHSDLTITSIASELNFTDESHLNKLFNHKLGITASVYRKKNKTM